MARILIVDDEPLIAMLAQDWLDELGHTVVGPAHDLPSALVLAAEPLDAAILDLSLGAQKSFPVARMLQERGVPFAFASGYARDALEPGFESVASITKPFEFERFSGMVANLLAAA